MKVKLSEEQIARLMNNQINESEYTSNTQPKEEDIKNIFGKYGQDIPNNVIKHIGENPTTIINKLKDLFPEKL